MRLSKPKLLYALRLRCPRCGRTPLRAPGSWFTFREGCPECDYSYERESGYFWGAAWIITYTGASLAALAAAAVMIWRYPEINSLWIAVAAVTPILPVAVLLHPFSRALWMWFDHLFHPLADHEHLGQKLD